MMKLWLVEMPWITANMGGIDYALIVGTEEDLRIAVPNWINEPEGTYPPYNEGVRFHEVEIIEQTETPPTPYEALAHPARQVRLIEGHSPTRRFAMFSENFGAMHETAEELEVYKPCLKQWCTLRVVKTYSWTFSDMLP